MVRVEVFLRNRFEIHNVPSIANIDWHSNNVLAIQAVVDQLKRRGLSLEDLQISAQNQEWDSTWNGELEHWL
jgi:hypothetical protein